MAIPLNDNIEINAPKPTDPRYFASTNIPWASVAAVNAGIVSSKRHLGLVVNINNVEYCYKNGITDGDLVLKMSGLNTGDQDVSGKEDKFNKDINNGYCGLDSAGKVPTKNLPTNPMRYIGVWNALTNTPTLTNPDTTKKGYVYEVSVEGTQFGIDFKLRDSLIYSDSGVPEKSDNTHAVINEISVVNPDRVPNNQSVINYIFRENLFANNKFKKQINLFFATPFNKDGFYFGDGSSPYYLDFVEAKNIFGYKGNCAKLDFTTFANGGLFIAKDNFENLNSFNNTLAANVEIYTPVAISGWYVFNQCTGSTVVTKGPTTNFSFSAGINILQFPLTLFDADYDSVWLRFFVSGGALNAKTIYYGRTFLYSGILDTTKRLQDTLYNESFQEADEIIKKTENLFIYNKFLENIGSPNLDALPSKTSFYFGTGIISQTYQDAFSVFGYKGNCINLQFGDIANGGLQILKSDFEENESYNGTVQMNWEIYSPVAISGTCKVFQGTSSSFVQKGSDIAFSFAIGVNILSIPFTTMDADYDNIWIRLFPSANQWDNQTVKFGRLLITSNEIEANQVESYIPEMNKNIYNLSEKVKSASPKSYWYGKRMVVLGDSITQMGMWQPEVVRAIGVIEVNRGLGGSTITPYITNETGKYATQSIYYRADAIDLDDPDLILLFGGQNDNLTAMGGAIPLGTISDAAYTGAEVSSSPPSFYASYKGTVEKLLTQNPTAVLKLITPLWSLDQTYALKKTKCDAIVEIGKLYGLEVINLLETLGINSINRTSFISDGVHPNAFGGETIGALISNKLR